MCFMKWNAHDQNEQIIHESINPFCGRVVLLVVLTKITIIQEPGNIQS